MQDFFHELPRLLIFAAFIGSIRLLYWYYERKPVGPTPALPFTFHARTDYYSVLVIGIFCVAVITGLIVAASATASPLRSILLTFAFIALGITILLFRKRKTLFGSPALFTVTTEGIALLSHHLWIPWRHIETIQLEFVPKGFKKLNVLYLNQPVACTEKTPLWYQKLRIYGGSMAVPLPSSLMEATNREVLVWIKEYCHRFNGAREEKVTLP